MKMENRKIQRLPTFLIVWNLIDIIVHIRLNMAETWRIAGNIVGIAAALIVLFANVKSYSPHILWGAAAAVIVLNAIHSSMYGAVLPMLVFIGVAVFLLLRWGQVIHAKDADRREDVALSTFLDLIAQELLRLEILIRIRANIKDACSASFLVARIDSNH